MSTATEIKARSESLRKGNKRLKKLLKREKRKSGRKKTRDENLSLVRRWKQDRDQKTAVDIFGNPLSEHMAMRAWENRRQIGSIKAEQHAANSLKKNSSLRWERQAVLEGRIFDFYSHEVGAAIEIDGYVHDTPEQSEKDRRSDALFLKKHDIRVFRVRKGGYSVLGAAKAAEALEPYAKRQKEKVLPSLTDKVIEMKEKRDSLRAPKAHARSASLLLSKIKTREEAQEELRALKRGIALAEAKMQALKDKFKL